MLLDLFNVKPHAGDSRLGAENVRVPGRTFSLEKAAEKIIPYC
jgi:hypothetical protein